jgi:hypothetical protein
MDDFGILERANITTRWWPVLVMARFRMQFTGHSWLPVATAKPAFRMTWTSKCLWDLCVDGRSGWTLRWMLMPLPAHLLWLRVSRTRWLRSKSSALLHLPDDASLVTIMADHDETGLTKAKEAARNWSAAGRTVRLALPDPGEDFNDMLRMCGRKETA